MNKNLKKCFWLKLFQIFHTETFSKDFCLTFNNRNFAGELRDISSIFLEAWCSLLKKACNHETTILSSGNSIVGLKTKTNSLLKLSVYTLVSGIFEFFIIIYNLKSDGWGAELGEQFDLLFEGWNVGLVHRNAQRTRACRSQWIPRRYLELFIWLCPLAATFRGRRL